MGKCITAQNKTKTTWWKLTLIRSKLLQSKSNIDNMDIGIDTVQVEALIIRYYIYIYNR